MKKKILVSVAALASGGALAVPLASLGATVRATTVITNCPNGVTPPSPYCATQTVTTADPPAATTVTEPSQSAEPTATAAEVQSAQTQAETQAGGAVTYVGQIGNLLVFAPADTPSLGDLLAGRTSSLTVYVVQAKADGTYVIVPTIYYSGGGRRAVAAATPKLALASTTKTVKAGQVVKVTIKLTKAQKAKVKKAKKVTLVTKITVTDSYGTKSTTQVKRLKVHTTKRTY